MDRKKLLQYEKQYRGELLDNVVPFWMKHSPDRENGGYFHYLDRDGTVVDTDKYMWPECREVWTFSMLYNSLERKPEWLDMAKLGIDFLQKYGRDENGDWYFVVDKTGRPVVQPYSIFSDCFAVMAFSEYAKATGRSEYLDIALKTYDRIQARKENPKGKYNKVVRENRALRNLSFPMININMSVLMNKIDPAPKYRLIIEQALKEIMTRFLDSEHRVIHENIKPEGGYLDSADGRHINPGHGIETMWFVMQAAGELGDGATVRKACEAARWCLEFGWDKEYDGIYYFMDKFGKPHFELQWDMKLWWPHLEALVALMLGYKMTRDEELFKWFEKVHEYTWARFPDPQYGEWFGYLNRAGQVNNLCKGNRWKGPFHLPRALFLVSEIIQDCLKSENDENRQYRP